MNRLGMNSVAGAGTGSRPASRDERFRVRQLPNESVFFYMKKIDNSRVVRQQDPKNHRKAWGGMLTTLGGAMLLIVVLLPASYTYIAGHELQALQHKREQLLVERRQLEVQEAQLLSPARLEHYAEVQKMTDPGSKVVYLQGEKGGSLAMVRSGGGSR
jgi:cell division protein FtsL